MAPILALACVALLTGKIFDTARPSVEGGGGAIEHYSHRRDG